MSDSRKWKVEINPWDGKPYTTCKKCDTDFEFEPSYEGNRPMCDKCRNSHKTRKCPPTTNKLCQFIGAGGGRGAVAGGGGGAATRKKTGHGDTLEQKPMCRSTHGYYAYEHGGICTTCWGFHGTRKCSNRECQDVFLSTFLGANPRCRNCRKMIKETRNSWGWL